MNQSITGFFLIFGLLVSQLVPTFGGSVGHVGNWVPFVSSVAIFLAAAFFLLISSSKIPNPVFCMFILYCAVMPSVFAIGAIFSEHEIKFDAYSDVFRFISIFFIFYCGYMAARRKILSFEILSSTVFVFVLFNFILFLSFFYDGYDGLIHYYSTREMGHSRFQGAWNYPYNLTIFLGFAIIFSISTFFRSRSFKVSVACVIVILLSVIMFFYAQARIAFIAFIAAAMAVLVLKLVETILHKRLSIPRRSTVYFNLFLLPFVFFIFIFYHESITTYLLTRFSYLFSIFDLSKVERAVELRGGQIESVRKNIASSPYALIFGFGPSREFPIWVESSVIYFQRYGLIGYVVLYLFPLGVLVYTSSMDYILNRSKDFYDISLAVFCFSVFFLVNSLTNNIVLHFRFIPLFVFLYGWYWGYRAGILRSAQRQVASQ